jgi:tuberous sclerosis protein 2
MELVRSLEFGLVSRCSRGCVRALAVCALEMQHAMMRLLPAILQKLSQISATASMAIPLMEFLSSNTILVFRPAFCTSE